MNKPPKIHTESIEAMIADGIAAILTMFEASQPVVVAFSGGKDSSVVANLVLLAAKHAAASGMNPLVVVTTGNTLVENPEVEIHARIELGKMREFGEKHGFRVIAKVVVPSLSSTWQVKVLTGRGLPSFAGNNSDCTVDMKIQPQQTFRRRLFRQMAKNGLGVPVTCLGTRFDESSRRAANMSSRGENASVPVRNEDGELVLSPIAHWTTDDVWEAIAIFGEQGFDSFSDFKETRRIYSHAESVSCAVVADVISSGRKRGGCGARTGCFVCLRAEDKSLENMVNYDERYDYARGLVRLNKFLRATRFDWSRRHWLGRTIKGGYIALEPDTYHPAMLRELFRYILQLDYDEAVRAQRSRTKPMFHILSEEMIIAIDAYWSLCGIARPFSAWADYRDIFERGIRYDIPDVEPVPETPMPTPRFLHVGSEWDESTEALISGMRDVYAEGLLENSPCSMDLRETDDGRIVWDIETGRSFEVDAESACMLIDFELEAMLAKHDAPLPPGGVTSGYKFYLQYGALSLSHSQLLKHDEILRRTAFKDRLGLSFEYDIQKLQAMAVDFNDLPEEARAAWEFKFKGKKAEARRKKKPTAAAGTIAVPSISSARPADMPKVVSYVPDINRGWRQPDLFETVAASV